MFQRPARAGLLVPLALSAGLLAARAFAAAPLGDPLGTPLPASLHLAYPPLYVLFAPLFTLWDGVSMLSMSRLRGFLIGLLVLHVLWRAGRAAWRRIVWSDRRPPRAPVRRELRLLAAELAALALFVGGGLLWHRPMAALAGTEPGDVVFDVHSHTNVSHDVRGTLMRGFDTGANLRWHRRAGFDAVFVTDHNTIAGLRAPHAEPPVLCPGIEVSAWRAHVVLLGDSVPVDQGRYNGSLDALLLLLRESAPTYGALSVLSLPEYELNHQMRLDTLVAAGAAGFELVNAAPKANEFSLARRDSVAALARRTNRFVVGASDTHGWGATSMVWNVMRVPEQPAGPALCTALLDGLRRGFGGSRIVERHRLRPDSRWPAWLTPVGVLWETWRGMNRTLAIAWLLWIWILWAAARRRDAESS